MSVVVVAALGLAGSGCSRDPAAAARRHVDRGDRYAQDGKYQEAAIEYARAIAEQPDSRAAHERLADASARAHDASTTARELVRLAELEPENVAAQVRAGAVFLLAGNYGEARDRAAAALQIDAADADAHLVLGQALAALDDRAGSEQSLREAVRLAPGSVDAHLALARHEWSAGRSADAEAECRRALDVDPRGAPANRAMALLLMATGRAAAAEAHWDAVASAPNGDPFALADFYVSQNRLGDAERVLGDLRSRPDRRDGADARLAGVQYALGRHSDAHATLDALLRRKPDDADALILRARFLLGEGRIDEASAAVGAAEQSAPRSADAVFLEGVLHQARHDSERAIDAFRRALKINPAAARAALVAADIRLRDGYPDDVPEWVDRAWEGQPREPSVRFAVVQLLLMSRNWAAAEQRARANAKEFPRSAVSHVQLGQALAGARRNDDARGAFSAALAIEPGRIDALAGLTALDVAEQRPGAARERLDRELKRRPRSSELLLLAGRTALAAGSPSDGEALLKRAIDADPANLAAYDQLGQLYIREQRLDAARREFERIEQRRGAGSGAATMVGLVLEAEGRAADARRQYERVLATNPRAAVAANNLAWLIMNENPDEALRLASMARDQLRGAPEVKDTLGWIDVRRGQHADAIRLLAEAVDARPDKAIYRYHLGMAYLRSGDTRHAREELTRALAGQPFPGADDARAALRQVEAADLAR